MKFFNLEFLMAFVLFAILGCTSQTVRLTPEEQKQFYSSNAMKSMTEVPMDPSLYQTFRANYCFNDSDSDCWLINCQGSGRAEKKCWKTPLSKEEVTQLNQGKNGLELSHSELAQAKETCGSAQIRLNEKKRGCFKYLSGASNKIPREEVLEVMSVFCALQNTICYQNGVRFGQNKEFQTMSEGDKSLSGRIAYPPSSKEPRLEVSFLLID